MTVTSTPVWHDIFRKVTLKPDNITLEAETYQDTLNIVRGPGVNFGAANTGTDTFEINVDYDISVPVATTKISLEDVNGNLSEITLTPGRGVAINRISAQELEFESFSVTETDTLHTVTERNNITSNKIFVNNIEVGTIASNSSEDGFTGYDGGHNLIGDGTLDNPMRFSPLYQDSLAANNTDQFEFIAVGPGTLAYAANYVFDTAATTGSVTLEREDPLNPGNWTTLDTQSGNTVGISYFIDGTYSELYSGSVTYRLTFAWTGNTGTATWYTNDTFEGGAYSPITAPQLKTDTDAKTVDINDIQFFQNTIRTTVSNTDVVIETAGSGQLRVLGDITADTLYGNVTGNLLGNVTGNVTGNVSGNAGTVTNGVYTTGSYADPSWITSLNASKIVGEINLSNIIVDGTISIYDNVIETTVSNANLELRANGTGVVAVTDNATVSGSITASQIIGVGSSGQPAITTSSATLNSAAWTTNGINLNLPSRTFVDTSSPAATVIPNVYINTIGSPTIDSTNAITVTDVYTLYVAAPTGGSNTTIANSSFAIYASGIKSTNFVGMLGDGEANTAQVTQLTANTNVFLGTNDTNNITINSKFVDGTQLRSSKLANDKLHLSAYDVDGATYTNLITLTASNTPTLTLASTGAMDISSTATGAINNMTIGDVTRAAGNFTTLNANGNVTLGDADTDTITVASSFVTGTVLRSAKSNGNTLNIAAYDVDGATYTNLITLTASNTPTLSLVSIGAMSISSTAAGDINNMNIGATTAATGRFSTLAVKDTSASFDVTISPSSSTTLTSGRTLTLDVVNAARSIKLAGNIDIANNLTTSGNFALTLTTTNTTSITLPTSGTLYGTASASITSAQLATSLSDETGSGVAVFGTNPTLASPTYGNASSTADADATVDAATTSFYAYIQSASGTARTINISNLTAGRVIQLYLRNTNAATKAINITASTTTTGFVAVNLSRGAGNTSASSITLSATSGTQTVTVFNANGTFGGSIG